jgi:hypothetical protein
MWVAGVRGKKAGTGCEAKLALLTFNVRVRYTQAKIAGAMESSFLQLTDALDYCRHLGDSQSQ